MKNTTTAVNEMLSLLGFGAFLLASLALFFFQVAEYTNFLG
jgi:hypothetical protein